jgi:hypothetical protein
MRAPAHNATDVAVVEKNYCRDWRESSCGSKIRGDFVADHTATVLARLDAAGASRRLPL